MRFTKPKISDFMTKHPHTINQHEHLLTAMQVMRDKNIRHLPVLDAGRIVGILSDRDVKWGLSFGEPKHLSVEDVMTCDPYVISDRASLEEVAFRMANGKFGAAIVADDDLKVQGIFTTTDALMALLMTLKDAEQDQEMTLAL